MSQSFFCRTGRTLAAVLAAVSMSAVGYSQTVVVSATQTANGTTIFNSIQAAMASFATADSTGGAGSNNGNAAPNVIKVATNAPITGYACADAQAANGNAEKLVMDEALTIEGDGGLAVFAGTVVPGQAVHSATNKPVFAWKQDVDITVKNLAIIPADNTANALVLVKSTTNAGPSRKAYFENVILTANDGSNNPVTTDGKNDPDINAGGVIRLADGGDAMFLISRAERGDLETTLKGCVIASFANSVTGNRTDAVINYMNGAAQPFINAVLKVEDGTVFANCPGFAIQNPYGGRIQVKGTAASPVVFRNIGNNCIYQTHDSAGQPSACEVEYAYFFNTNAIALLESGDMRNFVNFVKNSVFANVAGSAISAGGKLPIPQDGEATDECLIENTVFHNAGSTAGELTITSFSDRNFKVLNSYFTGTAAKPSMKGISHSGTGTVTVENSNFTITGDNALAGGMFAGTNLGNIVQVNVTNNEITYINTTDPFAPNFFKVQGSDVRDWSVY